MIAAASAARRGRAALTAAEVAISGQDLDGARRNLVVATDAFTRTRHEINAVGPLAAVGRVIPVVGDQVKAVDTFADAGLRLSQAAQPIVAAAESVVHPKDETVPVSSAMDALRSTQQSLGPAVAAISSATDQVIRLRGRFLIGPLARARDDLVARLPKIRDRAVSAEDGLSSLLAFAGETGPKRYLFLSQNPDEVRPTGGFIGTYGVLEADKGKMSLVRYDAIENWTTTHQQAVVPPSQAGSPFQYNTTLRRTLANVNSGPDWPSAAQLAANLWAAGGEQPVDGVISFTPGFMAKVLSVVGPVPVPEYGETVDAANVEDRLDFYTHRNTVLGSDRKEFVAVVAETVMHRLLDAPASQWVPLGQTMAAAFDARQAMAWSSDAQVQATLATRHWDGQFPTQAGDFFFNAEFEYAAKNGRGIRRAYDHHVVLHADGSARVTTTLTLTNTEPPDPLSPNGSLAYMTPYGPAGATLDPGASDPFALSEPTLAGHPASGWFKAAAPGGGTATLTVTWDVPALAVRQSNGSWSYDLTWLHLPDHTGDTVHLQVDLPAGWKWRDGPPPSQLSLDKDIAGSWAISGS